MQWAVFHEQAAGLAEAERSVFDLVFYAGLSQARAAAVLGLSPSAVSRRWAKASERAIFEAMGGELPD